MELGRSEDGRQHLAQEQKRMDDQHYELEVERNPELQALLQRHDEELEGIRKRHRLAGEASSSAGAKEQPERYPQGEPGASSSSSGSRVAEVGQYRRGQKRIPEVHARDLQGQAEQGDTPRGIKREPR